MRNQTGRLVIGGLLIVAGLQTLLNQAGVWDGVSILALWPLALVAVGVKRGATTGPGILWIGYGVVLLLSSLGVWALRDSWPILLVLHGVVLLTGRPLCGGARRPMGRNGLHVG
jgi:hypothetical protein